MDPTSGQAEHILTALDDEQRQVVRHGPGPALVLAGPGSGKTRAITHRMAYLLASSQAEASQVLALAFTSKAAEEMSTRLATLAGDEAREVRISTFHSLCLYLLRQWGDQIGLPPHFVVFDELAQEEALITALGEAGWYRYSTVYDLEDLRSYVTWQKSQGQSYSGEAEDGVVWSAIARRYQEILGQYGALDFDDLILRAVELLAQVDPIRQQVQERWACVFVDEYHDISPSQYALLTLLAPPPQANCMVVADTDQSIYGWRGAQPALVQRFEDEYRPEVLHLRSNYRSAAPIISLTQALISRAAGRSKRPSAIVARPRVDIPVSHHLFRRPEQETEWIAHTIRDLTGQDGLRFGDLAVLYRTHRRGDAIEQALSLQQIPVQRVRRLGIFEHPGSREILRYLQLIHSLADPAFKVAINFPRVIADELTMLQLQSLARREGITLIELARQIQRYPEVGPLTRHSIEEFLTAFDNELATLRGADAGRTVAHLLRTLQSWRSVYPEEEWPTLSGFAEYLDMGAEVRSLRQALDQGRVLHVLVSPTIAALCGAFILEDALEAYLGPRASVTVTSTTPSTLEGEEREETLQILASAAPNHQESQAGDAETAVTIRTRESGSIRYSIAVQAWRLAQGLVGSFETLDQERFVVYDLETTGKSTRHDDVVEMAAMTLDRGGTVEPAFHSLVHPRRPISREATEVHGIHNDDVRDAPPFEVTLPRFLAYLGDAILVGHNVNRFDNVILDREMSTLLHRGLSLPILDTMEMARRLIPHANLSLSALLDHFRLKERVVHRAESDVAATAAVLRRLLTENRRRREMEALAEYLPLVALGADAADSALVDENALLRTAALRALHLPGAEAVLRRFSEHLPPDLWFASSSALATLQKEVFTPSVDDYRWQALKREWEERTKLFVSMSEDPSLTAFLDYLSTFRDDDQYEPTKNAVTLMTIHNAKGKEFRAVIIAGLEEGEIPYWTAREDATVAEEQRVLYVGMTRAQERLYLTSVYERDGRRRNPSRFLNGLPARLLRRHYHY